MRRPLPLLIALALLAALLATAGGEPFTGAFQDLLSELNDREAALPATGLTKAQKKEKKALAKSFRALAADGKDLRGDLGTARKMAKALEKGYPGDDGIAALLHGALDDLMDDVLEERESLAIAITLLVEGRARDRAAKKLAGADDRFALAEAAATASGRAKEMGKGHRLVIRGAAAAEKGETAGPSGASSMTATVDGAPWAANRDFGTGVSGLATVLGSTESLRKFSVKGRRILPSSSDPRLPGDSTTLQITVQAATGSLGPGTYTVGNVDGVSVAATWIAEDESGSATFALAVSGTVAIETAEVRSGSVAVTGSFSFSMFDGVQETLFPVAYGNFAAPDLPRVTEP